MSTDKKEETSAKYRDPAGNASTSKTIDGSSPEAEAPQAPVCIACFGIKYRNDVNAIDHIGFSPIHNAALFGHADCVKGLLLLGADVNKVTRDEGETALHIASRLGTKNHEEVIRVLIRDGNADTNIKDFGAVKGSFVVPMQSEASSVIFNTSMIREEISQEGSPPSPSASPIRPALPFGNSHEDVAPDGVPRNEVPVPVCRTPPPINAEGLTALEAARGHQHVRNISAIMEEVHRRESATKKESSCSCCLIQ